MAQQQSFAALRPALSKATLACLQKDFRFSTMTPVQAAALPLLLTQKDVVAEAVTGSGKTIAFAVAAVAMVFSLSTDSLFVGLRAMQALPNGLGGSTPKIA